MDQRRCPDCGVTMESVTIRDAEGMRLQIAGERRDGLLGKLGLRDTTNLEGVCCPECGLVRTYADV